jgi:tRNA(adenine34) deaminase
VTDLFAMPFNHHPVVESGLRADEAQALLQAFFARLRAERGSRPKWTPPTGRPATPGGEPDAPDEKG